MQFLKQVKWDTGFVPSGCKFHDTAVVVRDIVNLGNMSAGVIDPTGADCLNAIPRGPGREQRIGNSVLIRKVLVTGAVAIYRNQFPLTVLPNTSPLFLSLVLDTQTNGKQMTSQLCYENTSGAKVTSSTGPRLRPETSSRFVELDNLCCTIWPPNFNFLKYTPPPPAPPVEIDIIELAEYSIPFQLQWEGELVCRYSHQFPLVSSIVDNSLHVVGYEGENEGISYYVSYNSRVWYEDPSDGS